MSRMVPSFPPTQLLWFNEQLIHKLEVELEPGKPDFHPPAYEFKKAGTKIKLTENTVI